MVEEPSSHEEIEKWDIFVSHASEDKQSFVEPLAAALSEFGIRVWFDKYELKLGDSLSRCIDKGLSASKYGIVVLSPAFIEKRWPEYELRGLTAREMAGGKVILPVWHNVTLDQVLAFSPPLADKFALSSSGSDPTQMAVEIIKAIRPELFTKILRRKAHLEFLSKAKTALFNVSSIRPSPVQHLELPEGLVGRVRLVRAALLNAYDHSMEFWLDGFKRDAYPSREISAWEKIAAVYLEYCSVTPGLTPSQLHKVYALVWSLSVNPDVSVLLKFAEDLPEGALELILKMYISSRPIGSGSEDFIGDASVAKRSHDQDREHFPQDLPDHLIVGLPYTKK